MEKVFRDPVHNLLGFDRERDKLILDLIETREVQRLRSIKLMGVSYVVYPGADHNRFSHSLGAAFLMKRIIERMQGLRYESQYAQTIELLNEHHELLIAAALLHDIGHYPFSHLLESHTKIDHEQWTTKLLVDPNSEVYQVLKSSDSSYPEKIKSIIERTYKPSFVSKFISSQLDVDRMDYLLRDSVHTGVGYGQFDLEWLIHSLRIIKHERDWEIAVDIEKGLRAAESYLLSRYNMFQQVYHHKTGRAAGVLVLQILKRASFLIDSGKAIFSTPALTTLITDPKKLETEQFIALDDVVLTYAIHAWRESDDEVLSDLCGRFLNRRLLKTISISESEFTQRENEISDLLNDLGFDPEYYLIFDRSKADPYKARFFLVNDDEVSESLFMANENLELSEITQHSDIVRAIAGRVYESDRICVPHEARPRIEKILSQSS